MKHQWKGYYCFAITTMLLLACDSAASSRSQTIATVESHEAASEPVAQSKDPYADTVTIAQRVDSIERLFKRQQDRLQMFARTSSGGMALVRVPNSEAWPEDTEVSINVFRDKAGTVLFHIESPTSESGDWSESVTHYFDSQGRTILREYYFGMFMPCENSDIVRLTIRTFVNPSSGEAIAETQAVTDGDRRRFKNPSECQVGGRPGPVKRSIRELPMPTQAGQ